MVNSEISAGNQALNLGSSFLERLGNQATNGFNQSLRNNPGGGGASEATQGPRYRSWGELYGLSTRTDSQGDFVGDKRRTTGGVAGFGAQIMPHVNIGFSIDQSHTKIDVPLALQTATLDLTQFGFSAAVDKGPWTWAIALVHGFGNIGSSRDTGLGFANASYGARIDGALTEVDYYWNIGQSRIVPKAGLEWVRSTTGALQEVGGLDPVTATGATFERTRGLIGAEVGHYWISARGYWICRPMASSSIISSRISARSWSASARRASPCRASAKASTVRMPAPRRRCSSATPRASISTTTPSCVPICSRTRARSGWSSSSSAAALFQTPVPKVQGIA